MKIKMEESDELMSEKTISAPVLDVINRLKAKTIATQSELGVRDEGAQRRKFVQTVPAHKYEEKSMHKFLIPTELAFPFNVLTGLADDDFNEVTKWRLTKDAITTALAVKALAAENPQLKQTLLGRVGMTDWPAMDVLDTLTNVDKEIFKPYRVARTFTETIAMIDSKPITGFDNPVGYAVNVERNEFGQVVGDVPVFLQIHKFFSDINYEEANHLKEVRKNSNAENWRENCESNHKILDNYNLVSMEEKKFKSEVLRAIYQQGLVSDERPVNYFVAYRFKIDRQTSLIEGYNEIANMSLDDLDKSLVLLKKSANLTEAFAKFEPGKPFHRNDRHFNFFELDMQGPESVEGDDKTKRMQVAMKTQVIPPSISVHSVDDDTTAEYPSGYKSGFYDSLVKAITKKNDDMESIEIRFRASTKARPLTEEVESLLVEEMKKINYIQNQPTFLTEEILKRNKGILTIIYGDTAIEYFAELEAGFSKVREGGTIDDEAKKGDMEDVDLKSFADDSEVVEDESSYTSKSVDVTELEL